MLHNISYKTLFGSKPLHIRFDEAYGLILVYDGIRYLELFGSEKYDALYNRIGHLISQEIGIAYIISHNYEQIKFDSHDSLPPEKTLNLYNVIILVELVFNLNKNHFY